MIYYGKTVYDYGFIEYFIFEKEFEERLKFIIPNIYSIYPNAYPSEQISKTNGSNTILEYDSSYKDAIILPK